MAFALSELSKDIPDGNIGLYREDGLGVLWDTPGNRADRTRKEIIRSSKCSRTLAWTSKKKKSLPFSSLPLAFTLCSILSIYSLSNETSQFRSICYWLPWCVSELVDGKLLPVPETQWLADVHTPTVQPAAQHNQEQPPINQPSTDGHFQRFRVLGGCMAAVRQRVRESGFSEPIDNVHNSLTWRKNFARTGCVGQKIWREPRFSGLFVLRSKSWRLCEGCLLGCSCAGLPIFQLKIARTLF